MVFPVYRGTVPRYAQEFILSVSALDPAPAPAPGFVFAYRAAAR